MNKSIHHRYKPVAKRRQRGLSIVELIVGMGIGLMVTMAIAYVLVNAENQRRTSSTGADAQINGGLAIYAIERQLKMAGYGITNDLASVGCALQTRYGGNAVTGAPPMLAPVLITEGLGGASDSIRILSSNARGFAVSVPLKRLAYDPTATDGRATNLATSTTMGVESGDLMVMVYQDGTRDCHLFEVTGITPNQFIGRADNARWNAAGFPSKASGKQTYMLNLGTLRDNTFLITADQRLRIDTFNLATRTVNSQDAQANIVLLKAFYGRDVNGDGIVDSFNAVTPATQADWQSVQAVRVAVVARSAQYEKEEITKANPTWDVGTAADVTGAVTCGTSKCITMKVDGLSTDWKHYRYRVYDTLVPLRNQVWRAENVDINDPGAVK